MKKDIRSRISAFTLVEVLICMAVIAILAAILFPVIGSMKEKGNRTVAMSNMQQCMIAFIMYSDDNGGGLVNLPSHPVAKTLVSTQLTWDPQDPFRHNWNEVTADASMVGSFGYLGGGISNPHYLIARDPNPPILVDYFHPRSIPTYDLLGLPASPTHVIEPHDCVFARLDGSAKVEECDKACGGLKDKSGYWTSEAGTLLGNRIGWDVYPNGDEPCDTKPPK